MTGPRRLDPDDLAPGDLFDHLEPLDTRCARAHTRDMTTTQTTALTIAGTPVVDLAVEWGTATVTFGGKVRTYPACKTQHGEILSAPREDGSGRWVIRSRKRTTWTAAAQ